MAGALLRAALFPALRRLERWRHFLRERLTPAGRFLLATGFAAAIFGVDTRLNQLHQLFTLALVLLLVSGVAALIGGWRLRACLHASRALPSTACVDVSLDYPVELRSHHRRPLEGLALTERLPDPRPTRKQFLDPTQAAAASDNWLDRRLGYPRWQRLLARNRWAAQLEPKALEPISPQGGLKVHLRLTPKRRGYLRLRGLWLTRPDPLGLTRVRVPILQEQSLLVLPKRYPAPMLSLPGHRRYQPGGWRLAAAVGESQEFIGLREYRAGDSPRLIHWPSWARTGEPVVKEYQDEYFTRHALVLDTFADTSSHDGFEAAVSVAASLCDRIGDGDSLLDLLFVGAEPYCLTGGRGLAGTAQFLEVLACAKPCETQPFERLQQALLGRIGALSAVVCVLLDFDQPRRALARTLGSLGLPARLLVVSDRPSEALIRGWTGAQVHRIRPARIAEDLARL